ncbi:MAG: hypothetical protein GC190_08155 [Alphaproteobacteria bacterium]|nr:hypothetical protein [Alphaproteobacteria bacterium]
MRLTLLSSASALTLAATFGQAYAAPDFTGVLEVYGGAGWASDRNFFLGADDPYFYGGKAKGYWSLSPDVHLQIDLFAQQTDNVINNWSSSDATVYGGSMHLLHPIGESARVGVAGSVWSNDVFDLPPLSGQLEVTYGLVALEGQYFTTNWTFSGQVGYFDDFSCGNCFVALTSGEYVRGKARYYFDDNTALTAEAMEMWGSYDDLMFTNKSLHSTTLGLEFERKFDASKFSGFLGVNYQRDAIDKYGSTSSVQTTSVSLGFKYYFDQPSVRSNDETGAELDTPTFGNAPALSGIMKF